MKLPKSTTGFSFPAHRWIVCCRSCVSNSKSGSRLIDALALAQRAQFAVENSQQQQLFATGPSCPEPGRPLLFGATGVNPTCRSSRATHNLCLREFFEELLPFVRGDATIARFVDPREPLTDLLLLPQERGPVGPVKVSLQLAAAVAVESE